MANDEELEKGLRNLEEILYRLDNRAKNIEWVKEHAPADASERIKEAIVENFPEPKVPPAPPAPPIPAPPIPAPAPAAPVEVPVIAPAPPPTPMPPPAPAPVIKPPEAKPEPAPVPAAPAPAVKPAKKPFVINKTAVILFCAGLVIAGVAYQLTLNSAAHRYAAAGNLVSRARNSEAISAYSKIIAQYPRAIEAAYSQYAIGDIKALQGDPAAAIEHYERYLVAAPDNDAKRASALFKIAEIKLKEGLLPDAEYLYQNAAVQASGYSVQAADRVNQIKAVNARLADAKKLIAKAPAKAVEAYTAVLAEHPKYAAVLSGLEEAGKALAAANARPPLKRAPVAKRKPAPVSSAPAAPGKPGQAPAAGKADDAKTQAEACGAIWTAEAAQTQLTPDMMFTKVKFNCDALKQDLSACRTARDEVMALQGVPPEARVQMEQEIDPDWTLAKQLEQDAKIRKNYDDRHCREFLKKFSN